MKNTTKGAIASGAAAVLLLGGAGSLAFWTDAVDLPGGSIEAGYMKLTTPDCGDGWILDGGATYGSQLLVPGDSLTKDCTFELDAAGEHLAATFDVDAPDDVTGDQALIDEIGVSATYTVNGDAVGDTGVSVADGDVVGVTLKLDWPYGVEDNDSNVSGGGLTATLDKLTVTATQTHDNS